jgi:hypothetical protein
MIREIADYLEQLKSELSGSDPAVVRDALADAEEHLTTALANAREKNPALAVGDALTGIIASYGSPAEVAAAYRETELRTRPPLAVPERYYERSLASRFVSVVYDPRAWGAVLYLLISMITGIIYFTWVSAGLYLSLGLIILVIGLPIAYLFLLSFRGIALVEGRIIEGLLGVRMPRRPIFSDRNLKWFQQLKALVRDGRTWLTVLYMLLMMPLGIIYFCITIVLFGVSLDFIGTPIKQYVFDLPLLQLDRLSVYVPDNLMPVVMFLGVLVFLVMMHVARGLGRLHAKLARAMLVGK